MKLELELNEDYLVNKLAKQLDEVHFNRFIMELIRVKYYSYDYNYAINNLEQLVANIQSQYITYIT